jgi:monoamine oxidase
MGQSLFRMLHRRYGTRLSGGDRRRRAAQHYERARSVIPLEIVQAWPRVGASPGTVAIIGAGFAGCAAAWVASGLGFEVKVYDALGAPGGRVRSSREVVSGRILEEGAELIGLNHPCWLTLAEIAGFALSAVTAEDKQGGGRLESPLILEGRSLGEKKQKQLYEDMQSVFDSWIAQSSVVAHPRAPWTTLDAPTLDAQNLGDNIPAGTSPAVITAIKTEFELNNTIPASKQSWLANLAQFQAGGGQAFFDDTEVFRCTAGNQQLAAWLVDDLPLVRQTISAIDTSDRVWLQFVDGRKEGPFDYLIVATSVAMWPSIEVDGKPFPYAGIESGPAIKYLAPVAKRFWISDGLSPDGMSDVLGMTWEGTDNQADTAGFDLTVFAGGPAARNAIDNDGTDHYFARLIAQLYPGFTTSGGTFVNWPENPAVRTGYSCPGPGQVVGAQRSYTSSYNECLFVAGEHTSPAWFGFMEGALESGMLAACRVAETAGVLPEV